MPQPAGRTKPQLKALRRVLKRYRLLVVDSARRRLLRRELDGSLVQHADLSAVSQKPWNDIVADDRGNAYVNTIGFDFPGGEFAPGLVVLVTPDGGVGQVADDLAFPNGMAISPDGGTLVVAESYANRLTGYDVGRDGGLGNRRVWAETPGDHPDGICMDAEGAVWYADVGNQHCVRVREGGEVLATVDLDRGAFACTLSRGGTRACSSSARPMVGPSRRNLAGASWRSRRPHQAPGDLDPARLGTAPGPDRLRPPVHRQPAHRWDPAAETMQGIDGSAGLAPHLLPGPRGRRSADRPDL